MIKIAATMSTNPSDFVLNEQANRILFRSTFLFFYL